jgi:hypothetical protein
MERRRGAPLHRHSSGAHIDCGRTPEGSPCYTRNRRPFVRRIFTHQLDLLKDAAIERFELEQRGWTDTGVRSARELPCTSAEQRQECLAWLRVRPERDLLDDRRSWSRRPWRDRLLHRLAYVLLPKMMSVAPAPAP